MLMERRARRRMPCSRHHDKVEGVIEMCGDRNQKIRQGEADDTSDNLVVIKRIGFCIRTKMLIRIQSRFLPVKVMDLM